MTNQTRNRKLDRLSSTGLLDALKRRSPTSLVKSLDDPTLTRGDVVRDDCGGLKGLYVGRTPAGAVWVCWSLRVEDYRTMCDALDRLSAR
jgi:hypothetical protein